MTTEPDARTARLPAHLTEAQHTLSSQKRQRVIAALQGILDDGCPVTFAEVARRAGVSRSLVYSGGLREDIEKARSQPTHNRREPRAVPVPRAEFQLLKQRNDKLREEVATLRQALRDKLGAEVEFGDAASLRQELQELRHDNDVLRTHVTELTSQLDGERTKRSDAEDALTAARGLVKKMIRDDNLQTN